MIDLGLGKNRLGGSALAQALSQLGDESPDIDPDLLKRAFRAVQQMISEEVILALHDRSDGGLLVAVSEMCMASNCGFLIHVNSHEATLAELFSEECGWVIEFDAEKRDKIEEICSKHNIKFDWIGCTLSDEKCIIEAPGFNVLFKDFIYNIRHFWEATSLELEKQQTTPDCVESEDQAVPKWPIGPKNTWGYYKTFEPEKTSDEVVRSTDKPKMAVIRDEGTNGDAEMRAAFFEAGFEVFDFAMTDLLSGRVTLDELQMITFAGGFSRMDVFESAKGWAGIIRENEKLSSMFDRFYNRQDTLSLGVCNGCQLMALLGWIPEKGLAREIQPRFIRNFSEKFESRWTQVEVLPSPSVLLAGMEGSKLGVWVAHGEGRVFFPDESIAKNVREQNLSPLAYVDPYGNVTERYPWNPNGSSDGVTALCTPDGRHLAMMPHPERCFRLSTWSWMPASWQKLEASPWLRMFQNARVWCAEHKQ